MRCALSCVTALALCVSTAVLPAQVRTFPYEAVVESDGVPVHSGPGYYVTNRLPRGARVMVHRHDPGGWSMIAPPAGEFSLVPADAVAKSDGATAQITAAETTARIGSRLSGEHNVEQVPLVQGDRVKLAAGVTAPAGWVAIEPPRGEFRWVPGKYLVPVQEQVRQQQDADPFALPTTARRPDIVDELSVAVDAKPSPAAIDRRPARPEPLETNVAASASSDRAMPRTQPADGSQALKLLDRELEGLTLVEPTEWPLEDLAAQYRLLKSTQAVSARQIDVRLAQLERMQMVREHYSQYVQLTSGTDERDAALVARSSGVQQAGGTPNTQFVHAAKPAADGVPPGAPLPMAPQSEAMAGQMPVPPHSMVPPHQTAMSPAQAVAMQGGIPQYPQNGLPQTIPQRDPRAMSHPQSAPGMPSVPQHPPAANAMSPQAVMAAQRQQPGASPAAVPAGPTLLAPEIPASGPPAAPPATPPAGFSPPAGGPQSSSGAAPQFDAVGVIQRAVEPHPEAPQHVLVSPSGEILVYLDSQGETQLDQYIGQPMGVQGQRMRHPEMSTALIVVERLTPVRF